MKLTDWLIERVDAQLIAKLVAFVISADVPFSDLNLARDACG